MEAIVLVGGLGTRLSHILDGVPKPMAPVAGRPFLEYVLDHLIEQGVNRIILAVCYKKEVIMNHFSNSYRGAEILYSIEEKPLFTGGAIKKALTFVSENRFFVVNGDTYFPIDFLSFREVAEKSSMPVAIAVKKMHHFSRYGTVVFDETGLISECLEKTPCEEGYINGGIYDIDKNALLEYPESFSLEEECFPTLVQNQKMIADIHDHFFIDIGVPEDFEKAQNIFREM